MRMSAGQTCPSEQPSLPPPKRLRGASDTRGSRLMSSGKLRITELPLMLKAVTSCALTAISGVRNVPSHNRHFLQGIKDIKIVKKSWVLPWHSCTLLDVSSVNYTFELQAMSAEKLPFLLPVVFTIGPKADEAESLLKYTRLLFAHDQYSNHANDLVQGVIEGETRVFATSMTMEQIFRGTKEFKKKVFDKVQLELNQFGLLTCNANVKQLVDVRGHEYFSCLGQKMQMEAANQARVDMVEARMKGEIRAKLRVGQTLQNVAKIDAKTKVIGTRR